MEQVPVEFMKLVIDGAPSGGISTKFVQLSMEHRPELGIVYLVDGPLYDSTDGLMFTLCDLMESISALFGNLDPHRCHRSPPTEVK